MMEDMTGQSPSIRDIDDAIAAITKLAHPSYMTKIAPEIYVNIMNIRRCLTDYKRLRGE